MSGSALWGALAISAVFLLSASGCAAPVATTTPTQVAQPTAVPTPVPTLTPSPAGTPTPTPAPTATPAPTLTPTPVPTATRSPTPTMLPTPTLISGIGTPISVAGVQLQLSSASFHDTYENLSTQNPLEFTLLVINGKVFSGPAPLGAIWDQGTEIINEVGRVSGRAYALTGLGANPVTFTWVFGVARTSKSLKLRLPEGKTIDLAPLLTRP